MRAPQDAARARRRRRLSRRGRIALIIVLAVLVVLFFSLRGIARFYTDYLWFDSLGFTSVWSELLASRILLGVIFTGLFFVLLWVNLLVADRIAPRFRPSGPEEELLERYFEVVGRRTGLVRAGVALLFALIAGVGVSQQWNNWLLFTHRVDFGQRDPLFNQDIGFYVFQLPFLSFLVSWLFAAFVIILIITAVAHYLNGGIRLQTPGQRVTPQVKAHLSVLLGVLALIKAFGYWLQRYELTVSTRAFVRGAGYTDVKAQLPAIMLLLFISLFSCGLFLFNIRRRGWVLPVLAVGLWALVAVIAGSAYPWFIQRFRVEPAESSQERPYIARNIAATREAYGISDVVNRDFTANEPITADMLTTPQGRSTLRNVRLLDPDIVDDTFRKRQADLGWLRFEDQLDVDRYQINGQETQVVVGARELNSDNLPQKSWEAQRLIYTHGYGMAMAPANEVVNQEPTFVVGGLPVAVSPEVDVQLNDQTARLYYSEALSGYSIVKTKKQEIGFQPDARFTGDTGVGIGSYLRRAAFALRFQDINPLISDSIQQDSRILFVRDVKERVQKVAPFLDFDSNPYPVAYDGRTVYVIDAYTTTDRYPYSEGAPASSLPTGSGLRHNFNYVRNSVKAVVDAYDGSVQLYLVPGPDGKVDPIAQSYADAFSKLFKPLSQMPEQLQQHLRHPEDLFRVQTTIYGRYHVEQPDAFYTGTRQWVVAQAPPRDAASAAAANPVRTTGTTVPGTPPPPVKERIAPQYLLMTLPDEEKQDYLNIRSFVPVSQDDEKEELTGWMAARPDGSMVVYNVPTQDVPGPSLVTSLILSNQDISARVTLLGQQGSRVEFGNLLLVPVNQSLLWVMPLYVSAAGQTQVPKLTDVIVVHNQQIERAPSLQEALIKLVGPEAGNADIVPGGPTVTPVPGAGSDGEATPSTTTTVPGTGSTTTTAPTTTAPGTPPTATPTVQQLAQTAQALFDQADQALRAGDLATYQTKVNQARAIVDQINQQYTPTTEKPEGA